MCESGIVVRVLAARPRVWCVYLGHAFLMNTMHAMSAEPSQTVSMSMSETVVRLLSKPKPIAGAQERRRRAEPPSTNVFLVRRVGNDIVLTHKVPKARCILGRPREVR
jgi:hypothetical protein